MLYHASLAYKGMEGIYIPSICSWPFKLVLHHTSSFPSHLQTPVAGMASHGSPCSPERHSTRAPIYQGMSLAVVSYQDITHIYIKASIWSDLSLSVSQVQNNMKIDQGCDQQPLHGSQRSTTTPATMLSSFPSFLSCCGPFAERTLKQDCKKKCGWLFIAQLWMQHITIKQICKNACNIHIYLYTCSYFSY